MQFDVTTGDYFGTLMSLVDELARRLLKEDGKKFDPMKHIKFKMICVQQVTI